jgi:hypothetical protein
MQVTSGAAGSPNVLLPPAMYDTQSDAPFLTIALLIKTVQVNLIRIIRGLDLPAEHRLGVNCDGSESNMSIMLPARFFHTVPAMKRYQITPPINWGSDRVVLVRGASRSCHAAMRQVWWRPRRPRRPGNCRHSTHAWCYLMPSDPSYYHLYYIFP